MTPRLRYPHAVVRPETSTLTIADGRETLEVRAVTLHVTKGPDAGRSIRLVEPTCIIGVGEAADFRLTDPGVSREHLRLTLTPAGVRLRDGGSKNGTYMGTSRVFEMMLTKDAAVVLGGTTLAIAIDAQAVTLPLSDSLQFGDAIGTSPIMRHLFATLERAAATNLTILIEGESGVGKDVLARAIHENSPRSRQPFVVADCGAIPGHLIESELFGHERGAFTGADRVRRGLFEEASGGTIFLDEVGELPLDLQPTLLRVLEQREVRPIGAQTPRPIDVRVVAATNRRLSEASRTGEFRTDLFYRLAVVKVTVPSLRERAEDIIPIARTMLRSKSRDPSADLPPDFASMLEAYAWPGNVRELRNVIERHVELGERAGLFDQAEAPTPASPDDALAALPYYEARKVVLDRFEEGYTERLIARAEGNITRAAEMAKIGRAMLYRILERVGPVKG